MTACPRCGHTGYRDYADPGAPIRATRIEAEADVCRRRRYGRGGLL